MKIEVDLSKCKLNNITPDQYTLLYLMYYKDYSLIEEIFTRKYAVNLKNKLISTKYILGKDTVTFKQTILSNSNVCKLLNIRTDVINFHDFYIEYPIKVGSRILRGNVGTQLYSKHEKKYLDRVTSIEQHNEAIAATKAYVNKQKVAGKLPFLQAMETVLNNSMWEQWAMFISASGEEGVDWNNDSI